MSQLSPEARVERKRQLTIAGAVIAIIAIVGAALFWLQAARDTTGQQATDPKSAEGNYSLAIGERSAPVKVVVYEDYLCPFCREFEMGSRDFLHADALAGKVYVEYRPIAFLNEYSARALNAFAAVLDEAGPTAALKFHNLLYDEQPAESATMPDNQFLIDLAVKAGAAKAEVTDAITNLKFKQWAINANDVASKAKVNQTPTVLVDGQPLAGTSIDEMVSSLESKIAG